MRPFPESPNVEVTDEMVKQVRFGTDLGLARWSIVTSVTFAANLYDRRHFFKINICSKYSGLSK